MKKTMFFALFIGLCSFVAADWLSLGPAGGSFKAMAGSVSNQNIMYLAQASTPAQIWKTTDAGNTWFRTGQAPAYVYHLAVDPSNPSIIYTTGVPYLYRSTNSGATWTSNYVPSNTVVYQVAVHPTTPTTIFTISSLYKDSVWFIGMYKSTNSGTSWMTETLGIDSSFYCWSQCLAIDPSNPNNIYVGGYRRKLGTSAYYPVIYKSSDGGNNYSYVSSSLPGSAGYVYSLAVHQTNSNYVYAGTTYGIYRSTDGGTSWSLVTTTSYMYNYAMATTPANVNLVYSTGTGYCYRSTDAGATWSQSNLGIRGSIFNGIVPSRTQSNVVFAANNVDHFKSTDTGVNWSPLHNGLIATAITTFINAPSAPAVMYNVIEGDAIYKTTNNGTSWAATPSPVSCGVICEFGVNYTNPSVVLGLEDGG